MTTLISSQAILSSGLWGGLCIIRDCCLQKWPHFCPHQWGSYVHFIVDRCLTYDITTGCDLVFLLKGTKHYFLGLVNKKVLKRYLRRTLGCSFRATTLTSGWWIQLTSSNTRISALWNLLLADFSLQIRHHWEKNPFMFPAEKVTSWYPFRVTSALNFVPQNIVYFKAKYYISILCSLLIKAKQIWKITVVHMVP